MPKFSLHSHPETIVTIARKQVFFQCLFRLPDEVKETTPLSEIQEIEQDITMGFYCDPVPGDQLRWKGIIWKGIIWKVLRRVHYPTRRNTQDEKKVAQLELEVGPRIEFEKFWPLSLKPFYSNGFELEYLYLALICHMQKRRLKVLKTRSIWGVQYP